VLTVSLTAEQAPMHLAVLRVDEVLKGRGEPVVLLSLGPAAGPAVSTSLRYERGSTGLWFLQVGPPGTQVSMLQTIIRNATSMPTSWATGWTNCGAVYVPSSPNAAS
jgi:hypothetical protein